MERAHKWSGDVLTAQVNVYPLGQDEIGPTIHRVIDILRVSGLVIETNAMATLLAGEPDVLLATLRDAFAAAAGEGSVVMTVTASNACSLPTRPA